MPQDDPDVLNHHEMFQEVPDIIIQHNPNAAATATRNALINNYFTRLIQWKQ